jgi:catechol 2,3-dioxygenase-like lactoylglutathione lyase family enzyme
MFIGGSYGSNGLEPHLTYRNRSRTLPGAVRATALNHVSISAADLEESTRFYERVFGMERIPTPRFDIPVQWLRVGDLQLHLFQDSGPAPARHHLGLTIDDLDAAYDAVRSASDEPFGMRMVELPSGQLQLYFRDPGGNLIELNYPDADSIDRSRYPELERLSDRIPQDSAADEAVLYLAPSA